MKRIISFTLLIITVIGSITAFGCESQHEYVRRNKPEFPYTEGDDKPYIHNCIQASKDLQYSDGRIYISMGKVPLKLNPATGLVTSLCTDPLCMHNNPGCPFFGMHPWCYISGDKIYYKRDFKYTKRDDNGMIIEKSEAFDSVCYDLKDGKLSIIEEYDAQGATEYLRQLFCDKYRFYYDYVYNEEDEKYYFNICRHDTETGKISVIGGDGNMEAITERFGFAIDGRIYFSDGQRLYSRKLDNTDEILHTSGVFGENALSDGKGVYFDLLSDNGRDVYYMPDMNDYSSAKKVIEGCSDWILTEHYLYYLDNEERIIGKNKITGYVGSDVILRGREIRRCSHNGENDELIFSFEGDYSGYQIRSLIVVDNYIYGLYQSWNDANGDGVFDDSENAGLSSGVGDIMRIDVTTGEVYFIEISE